MNAPGQLARPDFPRFGLWPYANRLPSRPQGRALSIVLPGVPAIKLSDAFADLPRTPLKADFHCVTTWSHLGVDWGGVAFAEFFRRRVLPAAVEPCAIVGAILRGQDGYRTSMLLEDLMATDVLIADALEGQPLTVAHGTPLRLVAPRHYGYKSVKHLCSIEFTTTAPVIKHGPLAFLDHPRARVALEERGRWVPGWLLRRLYRPLIVATVRRFWAGPAEH